MQIRCHEIITVDKTGYEIIPQKVLRASLCKTWFHCVLIIIVMSVELINDKVEGKFAISSQFKALFKF